MIVLSTKHNCSAVYFCAQGTNYKNKQSITIFITSCFKKQPKRQQHYIINLSFFSHTRFRFYWVMTLESIREDPILICAQIRNETDVEPNKWQAEMKQLVNVLDKIMGFKFTMLFCNLTRSFVHALRTVALKFKDFDIKDLLDAHFDDGLHDSILLIEMIIIIERIIYLLLVCTCCVSTQKCGIHLLRITKFGLVLHNAEKINLLFEFRNKNQCLPCLSDMNFDSKKKHWKLLWWQGNHR